jgi:hypothetical protein
MEETAPFERRQSFRNPERPNLKVILTAAVAIAASLGFYFLFAGPKSQLVVRNRSRLPFGAAEQAYAPKLQIENVTLSRAENFAHQEITSLSAGLLNTGDRWLKAVEITVEFSDELPQVILRESRVLFGGASAPLPPGGRREFEVSFEHVPSSWNMQQPSVAISGIEFAPINSTSLFTDVIYNIIDRVDFSTELHTSLKEFAPRAPLKSGARLSRRPRARLPPCDR